MMIGMMHIKKNLTGTTVSQISNLYIHCYSSNTFFINMSLAFPFIILY